ncbi:hypothetical protein DMC30DRAFT_93076 [Rhodotorula diobovata]|uniref:C3H1-type domain-containing protein n=1 Tax=Rhodotorula diobovata TaxID=5288 RepID=A0A5C5FN71_9BASI|nr:hypothetical protein DMC30DRAFT_93076 [Rhodotorula diobovata]
MPLLPGALSVHHSLRHLAKTAWDVEFLSNPTFASWTQGHVGADPPKKDEHLVDYVRARIPSRPSPYAPSASDLPPLPSITLSSSSPSPASSPPASPAPASAPAPAPPADANSMSFDGGFDDVLDMSSYAADEPSGLDDGANAFVDHSMDQFRTHSPVEPLFSSVQGAHLRAPSPFATYPGAVAPFTAPGTFYSRHATPPSTSLADATVAASSLAATADLIHQGRAQGAQPPQWNGFFASSAASSAGPAAPAAVAPGALFHAGAGQPGGPTMTITPSAISAPPPASSSASASRESTPRPAAPAAAKKLAASTSSSSSSSKTVRSASPAVPAALKRSAPSPASTYSPEHWTSFLPKIRTYLDSKRLQRAPVAAAQFLVRNLHGLFTYADRSSTASPWGDASDVPPEGRAEVLSAVASYGRDEFWRAWVDEGMAAPSTGGSGKGKEKEKSAHAEGAKSDGLELLQCWLEGASQRIAASSKDKEAGAAHKGSASKERKVIELEHATLLALLKVFAKLPLTFDHLRAHTGIPKRVKRISDRATDSVVKRAAADLVTKWSKVQVAARAGSAGAAMSSSSTAKRKADEKDGPAKKAKTGTSATTTASSSTAKKPAPAPAPNPLAKAGMPSFKKQPSATSASGGAGGSSALMEAIAKLKAGSGPKPPPPPPPPAPAPGPTAVGAGAGAASSTHVAPRRTGKPTGKPGGTAGNGGGPRVRKSVKWAPDDELEKVKLIEKAVYGDENGDEGAGALGESLDESLHLMQEQEGLSLAMHFEDEFEELIDWYEPVAVTLPESPEFELLSEPKQSHELELYPASDSASMDVDMPSESLAEPPEASQDAASTPEPDDKTKRIQLSADMANDPEVLQTIEDAQMSRAGAFASSDQISALLSQLTANGIVAGLDATAFGGAPGATDGTTMTTPHAPPFGAGPAAGPQVQPPPGQISAEALDALRSYPPEQVAAIVQANPAMAAGLDLAALGLVPGAAAGPQGGFDVPPHMQQRPAYVPPGFAAAQPYDGYVPPSAQPSAWGAPPPAADLYSGYQPPSHAHGHPPSTPYGRAAPTSAMPPAPHRRGLRPKKDTPCKYFKSRMGCDWGDKCAFSHDM